MLRRLYTSSSWPASAAYVARRRAAVLAEAHGRTVCTLTPSPRGHAVHERVEPAVRARGSGACGPRSGRCGLPLRAFQIAALRIRPGVDKGNGVFEGIASLASFSRELPMRQ